MFLGRARGRARGGSEYGGGSERSSVPGGSDYGSGLGRGNRGADRGRGRGYRGAPHGGVERGWPCGRGNRGRGRGVAGEASSVIEAPAVEAGGAIVEAGAIADAGGDVAEAGSYPLLALPTLSSVRTGPLPAEHVEATGVKRRKYGNAGRVVKLRSNHVEVKFDQRTLYHYDGMYLSYSSENN